MIFAVVAALGLMTGLLIVEPSTAKALPEQSDNRLRACSNYEAHQSGAAPVSILLVLNTDKDMHQTT